MPGLLGKKIGMTSVFSAEGQNVPCTVIEVGPCVVTQIKTVEKDGYAAVQVGFQDAKEKNTSAPLMGHFKKVRQYFDKQGVRALVDDRNEKIGRKIRDNELKRVPYMVIVGEKESAEGLVSMRKQGGGEQATMSMEEFAQRINAEVAEQLKAAEE